LVQCISRFALCDKGVNLICLTQKMQVEMRTDKNPKRETRNKKPEMSYADFFARSLNTLEQFRHSTAQSWKCWSR
jgi:hypothetical protein